MPGPVSVTEKSTSFCSGQISTPSTMLPSEVNLAALVSRLISDLVDFAVGGERGDDRGDDPAELCCHDGGSFTKSSYSDNGRPLPSAPLKEANGGMAKR